MAHDFSTMLYYIYLYFIMPFHCSLNIQVRISPPNPQDVTRIKRVEVSPPLKALYTQTHLKELAE